MRAMCVCLALAGCGKVNTSADAAMVGVTGVTSTVADGHYTIADTIPIAVTFSQPVTVTGTPHIAANNSAPPIAYTSGSGTTTLTFVYTVATNENVAKLDVTGLTLDGGTISATGTTVDLTIPAGALAASKAIAIIFTIAQTFDYTGATSQFMIPAGVTALIVDASGAQGGTSTGESGGQNLVGGKGAQTVGTFTVAPSTMLTVLVGGMGGNGNCGSGGGGGSFVVGPSNTLMVAAGGGGGGFHCIALGGVAGDDGRTTPNAGDGVCDPMRMPRPGGINGNGGSSEYGGGGGGFVSAGIGTADPTNGGGVYPGAGGSIGGGFGGGGGHFSACCGGSGGGGGYSGGSGGISDGCAGGGGGTLNSGMTTMTMGGVRSGNGVVVIRY